MTVKEWALAASVVFSGLSSGLLAMLAETSSGSRSIRGAANVSSFEDWLAAA